MGDDLDDLLALVEADANALKTGVRIFDLGAIKEQIERVLSETPAESLESPLGGDEIMELLGIEAGPQVGEAKSWLLERVLEGELEPLDRKGAQTMLLEWWKNR